MRLQVALSRAGVASRRAAERLIAGGRVRVNGRLVTELGTRVDPEHDALLVDGMPVGSPEPPATVMLHKPVRVVSTMKDPEGRETVADLLPGEPYRLVPVGRLDYHTEGLLLLTNDGGLMERLLHPRYHVPKVYRVKTTGRVSRNALDRLRTGVPLEDGRTEPTVVEVVESGPRHTWLEIIVTEGRNRLVRRMVEAVGHTARRVVRTELATLAVGGLRPGQYRYLDTGELHILYGVARLSDVPPLCDRARSVGSGARGQARRSRGAIPDR